MPERYDLLVLGGGVNGLGIAADAAARGLSVLLAERDDFGSGTTATSSRLIHGGLRYLQYGELSLVRESLRERGLLCRQRPHLVKPIELLIPLYDGQPLPGWKVGAGLALYDILARDPQFAHPRPLTRTQLLDRVPGLRFEGLHGGYIYPDAQIAFPERLCVELAQETVAAGGEVRNHTEAIALLQEGTRVVGATLRDRLSGQESEVRATLTINAAGPWVDAVNRLLRQPPPPLIGGTWGTHLVLPRRPGGPSAYLYATAARDGRPFFVLPWDERILVGTTDIKAEGLSPDAVQTQPWEREYLLDETNRLFPDARYTDSDIEATTVGVRPLPASARAAGAVTRRHFLVDHGRQNGLFGLASVVGGKLTTYRSLAEETVDQALGILGRPHRPCPTAAVVDPPDVAALTIAMGRALDAAGGPVGAAPRLVSLYGNATLDLAARIARDPSLAQPLAPGEDDLRVQALHGRRVEFARTADDLLRRRLVRLAPSDALRFVVEAHIDG